MPLGHHHAPSSMCWTWGLNPECDHDEDRFSNTLSPLMCASWSVHSAPGNILCPLGKQPPAQPLVETEPAFLCPCSGDWA